MSVYKGQEKVLNSITAVNEETMKEIAKEVYSTNETVIGTWIDGKPIYRKVVTGMSVVIIANNNWINIHAEPTIDTLVDLKVYDNNGLWYGAAIYRISDGYLQGYSTGIVTTVINYTIEYTKTTD